MKRPLTIAATALLAMLVLYACASTIRTSKTSFVTITIGGASGTALLKAEAATPWTRFKYFAADVKLMPEAYAYIPSIVQALVVTVTAPDMPTPIVGVSNLSSNQTLAEIRIEVPNGLARKFTVEGYHGLTSLVVYRASTEADLDGTDISLPISMQFNFAGSAIFVDPVAGNDLNSGLTPSLPLQTITRALTLQSTSTPYTAIPVIYAEQGDYLPVGAGGAETFPLQLNPNTALVCGGKGYTSAIGAVGTGTRIRGNDGASIDNCKVVVNTNLSIGIDDSKGGGPSPVPTVTKINGALIEISGGGSTDIMTGVAFAADSVLLETSVTGSNLGAFISYGVRVSSGRPSVLNSVITNLPTGIDLLAGAGRVLITGNTIANNTAGVNAAAATGPKIEANTFSNNNTGILVAAGGPEISGNSLDFNNVGIEVTASAGIPVITLNSIFCSFNADLFSTASSTLDVSNNSWDHDSATVPPGPEEWVSVNGRFDCNFGADICSQNGPMPIYLPARAAVPNGCLVPAPN